MPSYNDTRVIFDLGVPWNIVLAFDTPVTVTEGNYDKEYWGIQPLEVNGASITCIRMTPALKTKMGELGCRKDSQVTITKMPQQSNPGRTFFEVVYNGQIDSAKEPGVDIAPTAPGLAPTPTPEFENPIAPAVQATPPPVAVDDSLVAEAKEKAEVLKALDSLKVAEDAIKDILTSLQHVLGHLAEVRATLVEDDDLPF